MFLCDDCHKDCGCFCLSRSYGPCEGCKKTSSCADCHGSPRKEVTPMAKKKLSKKKC